ncbi:diphthine--ammonia ligase [Haladaptatus sp. DYF46]|uniref:Dph6-related ATP pyrophosphatase n=1 Tax=Haladaptatus sp. DYF46 TaxID=2886041 RepID=UPI001E629C52|nr:diphthine--ammonia ligase [Haladaptatus sp. DYF46]
MTRRNTEQAPMDINGSLPTAFCSWSGGKDSCFACFRAMKEYDVVQLVHMAVRDDAQTGFDAVDEILVAQARSMGIPLIRRRVDWESYEPTYRETLSTVESNTGVFGNVTGPELRAWVDDLCDDLDLTPVYPLWDGNPIELYRSFIERGFEARIVKIDAERVADRWLGAPLDEEFLDYLLANDLHPMGEFGEYHTVTIDGPLFETRIPIRITGRTTDDSALIATVELDD